MGKKFVPGFEPRRGGVKKKFPAAGYFLKNKLKKIKVDSSFGFYLYESIFEKVHFYSPIFTF